MKKILALLLALVMIFALAACGEGKDTSDKSPETTEVPKGLEGTWEWVVAVDGKAMGVEEFKGSFSVTTLFQFNEDDTYELSIDEEALMDSLDSFEDDLVEYMIDTVYNSEDMANMSKDEINNAFQTGYGCTLEEFCQKTVDEMNLKSNMKKVVDTQEGTYKTEDDQLTLSATGEEDTVFTYTLDGDTLELSGDVEGLEKLMEMIEEDSLVLKRVS